MNRGLVVRRHPSLARIFVCLAAAGLAAAIAIAQSQALGNITVVVTNIRNEKGEVLISLYNRADGFPRDQNAIIRSAVVPAESGSISTVFEGLPHGDYAVAVLHDEDASLDMTFGFLNLPKEGYCFSNNVKVKLKAPSFEKVKFALDGDTVTQTLRMRY